MQIENPMAITIIKNVMRVNTSFYQRINSRRGSGQRGAPKSYLSSSSSSYREIAEFE